MRVFSLGRKPLKGVSSGDTLVYSSKETRGKLESTVHGQCGSMGSDAQVHGTYLKRAHPGTHQLPGLSLLILLPVVKLSCLPGQKVSFGSSGILGSYEIPCLPNLPCSVPVALVNHRLLPQSIPEPLLSLHPHFKTSSIFLNSVKQTAARTVLL